MQPIQENAEPLPGYREPKPMVWSGLFPSAGEDFGLLRDALDRLRLSDAALKFFRWALANGQAGAQLPS